MLPMSCCVLMVLRFAGSLPRCHSAGRYRGRWWRATGRHRYRVLPRIRLFGRDRAGDGCARLSVCDSSRLPTPLLRGNSANRGARSRDRGSLPVPLLFRDRGCLPVPLFFSCSSVLPVSQPSSSHRRKPTVLPLQCELCGHHRAR